VGNARAGVFTERVSQRQVSYLIRRNGVGLLVYLAAIAMAFLDATASLALCGLTAVYYTFPGRPPD
jgi:hypothetical protein